MPGHGRLVVKVTLQEIVPHMKLLNPHCLYLLKFHLGGTQLIPNKNFLSLDQSNQYCC